MGEKPTEADEATERRAPQKQEDASAGGGGEAERFLKINAEPESRIGGPFIKLERETDPGSAPGIAVSDPGVPGDKGGTKK